VSTKDPDLVAVYAVQTRRLSALLKTAKEMRTTSVRHFYFKAVSAYYQLKMRILKSTVMIPLWMMRALNPQPLPTSSLEYGERTIIVFQVTPCRPRRVQCFASMGKKNAIVKSVGV
jgi:hypothetical protein